MEAASTWDSSRSLPPPYGPVCECFFGGFWWVCVVEALDARLGGCSSLRPAAAALLARAGCGDGRRRGRADAAAFDAVYRVRVLAECPAGGGGGGGQGEGAAGGGFPLPVGSAEALRAAASCGDTFTLLAHTDLRPLGWASHARLAARLEAGAPTAPAPAPAPLAPPRGVPPAQWEKRKQLWRRWEEGVRMDAEGWRSVTPEAAALHMAAQAAAAAAARGGGRLLVLDAFAGWGGNAIAFARGGAHVVAVEASLPRLRQAQHNAGVYGADVAPAGGAITWVHGDGREVVAALSAAAGRGVGRAEWEPVLAGWARLDAGAPPLDSHAVAEACRGLAARLGGGATTAAASAAPLLDVAFLAPPWGGDSYKESGKRRRGGEEEGFSLARHMTLSGCGGEGMRGDALLRLAAAPGVAAVVQAFLPKHTALGELRGALLGLPAAEPAVVPVRWVDLDPVEGGGAVAPLPADGAAALDVSLLGLGGHAVGLLATATHARMI